MIVTINTDASFHKQLQRGSFAFWIVCNEFKITRSGILRKKCHRPELAEFRCIINAVHVLLTQDLKSVKKIIINTDCLNVIHLLTKNKKAIQMYQLGSWGNNLVLRFEMMLAQLNRKIEIEYRHVKSHEHTDTAKNWVNDWCDKNAKKALWDAINNTKK